MSIRLLAFVTLFFVGSGVVVWGVQGNEKQDPVAKKQDPVAQKQDPVAQKQDTEKPKALDNRPFMERKLEAAKNIVAGLSTEDFELIAKSASDLTLLSQESQWEVFQTDSYMRMSTDFRDSSTLLRDTARDKNLDGATLAFFEVTLNCVRCHKYIRTNPK